VLLGHLKWLTLEYQNWFYFSLDVNRSLKLICSLKVFDTKLKHIKNMASKGASHDQVVRSLLLMVSNHKQRGVMFACYLLNCTWIVKWLYLIRFLSQEFRQVISTHAM